MKKKFKVLFDDSGYSSSYSVWSIQSKELVQYRYAEFYGKYARHFAYEHCKRLNLLPEKNKS